MENKDDVIISYQKNNSLNAFIGAYSPKDIALAISSTEEITGFKILRKTSVEINEETLKAAKDMGADDELAKLTAENEKFTSAHYFIGKVLTFDEIKDSFNNPDEIEDKYKEVKYAVSYDKDGAVYDIKPLLYPEYTTIAVKDQKELFEAYRKETGCDFLAKQNNA